MAQTKTGFLRFRAPSGEVVERPQEEVQSLRQAGFAPEAGQSLLVRNAQGGFRKVPVERLSQISPEEELPIPTSQMAFKGAAEERFGGTLGGAQALLYGGLQGASSGLGGAALMSSGLVEPETLAMLKEARPGLSFLGEAAGMGAQAVALGGLGTAARGAGAVAKGAEAASVASKAAPSLRSAMARGAAREAAFGAGYGAGSEITEAMIEGRQARPLEAAGFTGLVGGAAGALFPAVGRGLGTLKGAAQRLGAEKVAESETLRAAQLAKAEQKLASAKTAEQRAAARDELKTLRDAAKAAEKTTEADIKVKVATALDDEAINAGADAQKKLADYRTKLGADIDVRMAGVGDALEKINATDVQLKEMGFTSVSSAQAKLTSEVESLGRKIEEIGADIKARDAIGTNTKKVSDAKETLVTTLGKAKDQRANAAREVSVARQNYQNLKAAGARAEQLAAAQERLTMSEVQEKLIADHLNALEEHGGALHAFNQMIESGRTLGKNLGIVEGNLARETARSISLARDLERIVPEELRPATESGDSALALSEAMARRMGMAPSLAEIMPSVGARDVSFGAGIGRAMTKESTERMLVSASRTGAEEFIDTLIKIGDTGMRKPKGLAIPRDIIGANKADIMLWLSSEDGARAIASLDETQRARVLNDVVAGMTFGKKSAGNTAKQDVVRLLKKKGPATPLTVPEGELQAALTRVKQEAGAVAPEALAKKAPAVVPAAGTPEAAYAEAKSAARLSMEGEREASRVAQQSLADMAEKLNQQKVALQAKIAEDARELNRLQGNVKTTAYERKMAPLGQAQESLARKIESNQQLYQQLTAAEETLLSKSKAPIVDQAALSQAQNDVVSAVNLLQQSKMTRDLDVLAARKRGLEAERLTKQSMLYEVMGGDGVTGIAQIRRDAGQVIDAFRQQFGTIGKIEKSAITNKYYAPGQDKVIERSMQEYMRTPEGKKLASAMAAAEKAQASKAARATEAKVRKAAGAVAKEEAPSAAQAAKDALTDPAVIAATVMGGPASGLGVMAAMVASRSGKGGIRQMLTSMSPLFFYQALERVATVGQKMAMAPIGRAALVEGASKLDQVTRKDVQRANTYVDDILREQEDARNAFSLTAKSVRFPVDQIAPLEQQYQKAVGELEKIRPKGMGSGPVSAEEEEFVRAYRLITSPDALARAFEQGTLSKGQLAVLSAVSPSAYSALEHMVKVVHDERPAALSPRLRQAFNFSISQSDSGLSVGSAMKYMNASTQVQQPEESLGTSRPPNANNSGIVQRAKLP